MSVDFNFKPQPINGHKSGLKHKKRFFKKFIVIFILAILMLFISVFASFAIWMNAQLSPVDKNSSQNIEVVIESGSTAIEIADQLEELKVIRSSTAFDIFVRYIGKNNNLQAGIYDLSPAKTTQQIADQIIKGEVKSFSITFFPGATLIDNYTKDESKKYDITTVLSRAGFSKEEIKLALEKDYDSPIFKDKPAGTDLEGYIYGETYNFDYGVSVESILETTFSEFYRIIEENQLEKAFADRGLNLYQAITLASIIQKEANTPDSQKQVAQVFYSRLLFGMSLGSDVTYQYIADKLGVERDINLDSPYNTRRYAGLPPGPIAVPGLSALMAVAYPAEGDYLFFLAGDDGKIYFAKTQYEHDQNIINYCQVGCSTL